MGEDQFDFGGRFVVRHSLGQNNRRAEQTENGRPDSSRDDQQSRQPAIFSRRERFAKIF